MTDAEALELLSAYADTAATYLTMYVSFTFAYLTVAYFVGRSLTRFQCFAVSGLYIISTSLAGASTVAWSSAWTNIKLNQRTIVDDVWLMQNFYWVETLSILLVSLGIISLYFMYDIRRDRTKSAEDGK